MARSRQSGECFEYSITKFIITNFKPKFYDDKSMLKFIKWEKDYVYKRPNMPIIDEFNKYTKIRLCTDKEGCSGSNADIILCNNTDSLALSLKNNNLYIKHPRANSMQLIQPLQSIYLDKYNILNDKYYQMAMENKYNAFSDFPKEEKTKMYFKFITLLYDFYKNSHQSCINIFKFCLGVYDTNQIIIKQKNDIIECLKYRNIDYTSIITIELLSYNSFYINIAGIGLKFRIHNASSQITKNLSLKYSVDPINVDMLLFNEYTI